MTRNAALLAAPRRATGFTQRALAASAGRKQPVIARIEAGASDTTIGTLNALLLPTGHRIAAIPTLRATVAEAVLELGAFVTLGDDDAAFRTVIQISDTLAAAGMVERVVLAAAPAPPTHSRRYDTLVAAVVEHHLDGLPIPHWVVATPALAEPWHVDPYTERHHVHSRRSATQRLPLRIRTRQCLMTVTLTYSELVDGLHDLVHRAKPANLAADIRIVGGTAVARLHPDTERPTQDVDAYIRATETDRAALDALVAAIANERGWEPDWLNSKATMLLPVDGEPYDWQPLCSDGGIDVWIAKPDLAARPVILPIRFGIRPGDRRRSSGVRTDTTTTMIGRFLPRPSLQRCRVSRPGRRCRWCLCLR